MPRIGSELHHILGRGWVGADTEYNFAASCRDCHEAVERTNEGKAISLYAKMISANLDLQFLSTSVGYSVTGQLQNWQQELPHLKEKIQKLLVHPSARY